MTRRITRRQALLGLLTAGAVTLGGDDEERSERKRMTAAKHHPHPHPGPHPNPPPPTPPPTPAPVPPVPSPLPTPTPAPAAGYTFADDFTGPAGSAPNPKLWTYDLGNQDGFGNGELEVYTSARSNSYLNGQGQLVIAATKSGTTYNSARLKTEGLFSQLGGYFEASIKVNSQPGLWPAFWMLGQDMPTVSWPQCGEVDILEDYGKTPQFIETTVHTPNGENTYSVDADIASDGKWHVYLCHWNLAAETFTFYRDGAQYLNVTASEFPASSWVFGPAKPNNGGMFIILNLAVGGFVGTPAPAAWPVQMLVDYVHCWQ